MAMILGMMMCFRRNDFEVKDISFKNHTFEKQQKWYKVQSSKEYTCAREVAEEAKFSSWTA